MSKRLTLSLLAPVLLFAGCASGPPFIDQAQPEAMTVAERRAQFEFNCPAAKGQLISRQLIEPVSFRFGIERAEYTIGVSGCGKRATYVVLCPNQTGSTCFAGAGRDGIM